MGLGRRNGRGDREVGGRGGRCDVSVPHVERMQGRRKGPGGGRSQAGAATGSGLRQARPCGAHVWLGPRVPARWARGFPRRAQGGKRHSRLKRLGVSFLAGLGGLTVLLTSSRGRKETVWSEAPTLVGFLESPGSVCVCVCVCVEGAAQSNPPPAPREWGALLHS
jgi:hypothetical protein